ncbi:MAG TPA: metal ABC transporter substrate-binding protein [Polyangia bacterium]|nr:metal ABC transporter substrate-binding protein [Polyangia bacterium]
MKRACLLALIVLGAWQQPALAKLRVVTSIETLAALSREVGGDRVDVRSLSRGYEDPHFVQAKPSLVVTLNRADALVYVGLELEVGWLPPLVQQSRNPKIQQGQPGNIDCSSAIKVEDVPNVPADKLRALGDIHPLGNPHYWIPPQNALAIAGLLGQRFAQLDPAGADGYRGRAADFAKRLQAKQTDWLKQAAPLRGVRVVSYHKSWSYVARWLGLEEVGYIEPKPGVPPSTQHTAMLIELMRKDGVRSVLEESFYPRNLAQVVADKAGAKLAILPSDVGAEPSIKTYFDLVDAVLAILRQKS